LQQYSQSIALASISVFCCYLFVAFIWWETSLFARTLPYLILIDTV
jgi:hypothetical protein